MRRQPYINTLEMIGRTPLLAVHRLDTGPCQLFLKLENQNPGGSIKDRIGLYLIEAAERDGRIKPGGTLIEATAGNTGLGLALVAAQKGYRLQLVIPDKMSQEKIFHLKAMGAEVVMTRSDVGKGHPEYYQDLAARLARETPGSYYVNQFGNDANIRAHEETTAPEIWEQMEHKLDAVVCGVGTGGTITGLSRYFARTAPDVEMVLADPAGSALADYVRTGKVGALGTRLARRRHRRRLRARGLRSVAREARPTPFPMPKRFTPAASCSRRKASSPALRPARCSRRRCATAASRRRRSAWSRSSATAATSICPRSTTTTG